MKLECNIFFKKQVYGDMTNRYQLLLFLFLFTSLGAKSQAIGKLQISADLSAIVAYDPTIEVSVINMSTNKEMVRKKVSEIFDFAFPLNGRFLLYFKKEGYQTTRLMLDTHTFMSGVYTVRFDLGISQGDSDSVELSTIPVGTIKFDKRSTNFGFRASDLLANQTVNIVSSIRESEVVSF